MRMKSPAWLLPTTTSNEVRNLGNHTSSSQLHGCRGAGEDWRGSRRCRCPGRGWAAAFRRRRSVSFFFPPLSLSLQLTSSFLFVPLIALWRRELARLRACVCACVRACLGVVHKGNSPNWAAASIKSISCRLCGCCFDDATGHNMPTHAHLRSGP